MADSGSAELRKALEFLRRRWFVVVILTFVSAGAAFAFAKRQPKTYTATAAMQVEPLATDSSDSSIINLFIDPQITLQNDSDLIQSEAVLKVAAQNLGLPSDAPLLGAISVPPSDGGLILDIKATARSAAQAAAWANAVATGFIQYQRTQAADQVQTQRTNYNQQVTTLTNEINAAKAAADPTNQVPSLTTQLNQVEQSLAILPTAAALSTGGGSIVTPATPPSEPSGPRIKVDSALGALIGLLLGVGLVFLTESLDDRLRSADDVEERTGVPNLGHIPASRRLVAPGRLLAVLSEPTSGVAEAYRTIRTNLQFLSADQPLRSLLITSAVPGEGKSSTAANLSVAFALGGTKTVLVSGDLRKPTVHQYFGLDNRIGLADAMRPDGRLDAVLQRIDVPDFRLLAAGTLPPDPTEILTSHRFRDLLQVLVRGADLVIVDTPPVLGLADTSMLASQVDGILMIVRPGTVKRRAMVQAVRQIEKAGGRLVGTVLNAVTSDAGYGYRYKDMERYYHHHHDADRGPRVARQIPRIWDHEETRSPSSDPNPDRPASDQEVPGEQYEAGEPTSGPSEALWSGNGAVPYVNGNAPAGDGPVGPEPSGITGGGSSTAPIRGPQ